jgi:hypothetical protein
MTSDQPHNIQHSKLTIHSTKSLQTINPFNMSLMTASVNICSVTTCSLIVDKVGRRTITSDRSSDPDLRTTDYGRT